MKKECCPDVDEHGPLCAWSHCFKERDLLQKRLNIEFERAEENFASYERIKSKVDIAIKALKHIYLDCQHYKAKDARAFAKGTAEGALIEMGFPLGTEPEKK